MDTFLWWSGVVAWAVAGSVGCMVALDWFIDYAVRSLGVYRELMAFIWERARKRSQEIPGG